MAIRCDGHVVFVGFWVVVVASAVVVVFAAVVLVCFGPDDFLSGRAGFEEVEASDVAVGLPGVSSAGALTCVEHAAPTPDNASTAARATNRGERQFTR